MQFLCCFRIHRETRAVRMPILLPIIAQPTFLEGHVPILTSDNWSGMARVPKEWKGTIVGSLGAVYTLYVTSSTVVVN